MAFDEDKLGCTVLVVESLDKAVVVAESLAVVGTVTDRRTVVDLDLKRKICHKFNLHHHRRCDNFYSIAETQTCLLRLGTENNADRFIKLECLSNSGTMTSHCARKFTCETYPADNKVVVAAVDLATYRATTSRMRCKFRSRKSVGGEERIE